MMLYNLDAPDAVYVLNNDNDETDDLEETNNFIPVNEEKS